MLIRLRATQLTLCTQDRIQRGLIVHIVLPNVNGVQYAQNSACFARARRSLHEREALLVHGGVDGVQLGGIVFEAQVPHELVRAAFHLPAVDHLFVQFVRLKIKQYVNMQNGAYTTRNIPDFINYKFSIGIMKKQLQCTI